MLSILLPTALLVALASAKTDLAGCTSSTVIVDGGASLLYYVPSNGEICSFLDCGGGRAPPKTTVPGCPQYSGTASYTPDFISGFGQHNVVASSTFTPAPILSFDTSKGMYVLPSSTAAEEASSASASASGSKATITSAPSASGSASHSGSGTGSATGSAASGAASPSSTSTPGAGNALGMAGGLVGAVAGIVGLAVL